MQEILIELKKNAKLWFQSWLKFIKIELFELKLIQNRINWCNLLETIKIN